MVNSAGVNSSSAATVPIFVKQDPTVVLMSSQVTTDAITNSVITVSDFTLQWLPQNETLLKD